MNKNGRSWKIVEVVIAALIVGLLTWNIKTVGAFDKRLSVVESDKEWLVKRLDRIEGKVDLLLIKKAGGS